MKMYINNFNQKKLSSIRRIKIIKLLFINVFVQFLHLTLTLQQLVRLKQNKKMIPQIVYYYPIHLQYSIPYYQAISPFGINLFSQKLKELTILDYQYELMNQKFILTSNRDFNLQTQLQSDPQVIYTPVSQKQQHSNQHQNISKKLSVINNIPLKKQGKEGQKQGRNANSNLLRMFFRNLEQKLEMKPHLVNYIINKNKLNINSRKFFQWYEINRVEYKNYIRLPSVKKLFKGKQSSSAFNHIMRVFLQDFLKKDVYSFYLTSKKIKKTAMQYNLYSIRNIFREIIQCD